MIFLYHILICWWTVQQNPKFSHSWMDFQDTTRSRWHLKTWKKTAFITPWGTFCYRVMPFGLKNARATYQRAMTTLFHDMMHKEVEVYVDDMIAKSENEEDHIQNLTKL